MSQEARRRNAERELRERAGEAADAAPDLESPRYSRGEETGPDTPARHHIGRFSEGQEDAGPEPGREHVGRFDEGQDTAGQLVDDLHVGRFSEGVGGGAHGAQETPHEEEEPREPA
jgi:hypothetical protein